MASSFSSSSVIKKTTARENQPNTFHHYVAVSNHLHNLQREKLRNVLESNLVEKEFALPESNFIKPFLESEGNVKTKVGLGLGSENIHIFFFFDFFMLFQKRLTPSFSFL